MIVSMMKTNETPAKLQVSMVSVRCPCCHAFRSGLLRQSYLAGTIVVLFEPKEVSQSGFYD